jgi:hypothetical protein
LEALLPRFQLMISLDRTVGFVCLMPLLGLENFASQQQL